MKIAIIGSRSIKSVVFEEYLPQGKFEIISGGASGVDTCAKEFAQKNKLPFTEILPQYNIYRRAAPIKRNEQIVLLADVVYAFWDGKSKGTESVINFCEKTGKPVKVFLIKP